MDEISHSEWAKDTLAKIPDFIKNNIDVIGLEDYTDYTVAELGVKFIAYVAYFNLSVITRRQIERSSVGVAKHEQAPVADAVSSVADSGDKTLDVKFSLVFIIYKVKRLWPALDFVAWHMFSAISVTVMLLALHWKLSVATLVYILIVLLYYLLLPFSLQPNRVPAQDESALDPNEVTSLWTAEDRAAKSTIIKSKNFAVLLLAFFTICAVLVLHLSANLQAIKV